MNKTTLFQKQQIFINDTVVGIRQKICDEIVENEEKLHSLYSLLRYITIYNSNHKNKDLVFSLSSIIVDNYYVNNICHKCSGVDKKLRDNKCYCCRNLCNIKNLMDKGRVYRFWFVCGSVVTTSVLGLILLAFFRR